jgi:hypothetical protein
VEQVRATCPKTADLFLRFAELYAFSKVEQDLGTFREHDYLTTAQGHLISEYVTDLCNEIAESSVRVIDAYGYADLINGSAVAQKDGQVYQHYTEMVESWPGCYQKASWIGLLSELRKAF